MSHILPSHFHVLVHPVSRLEGTLRAQPSKNYSTRYLIAAALSGESLIHLPSRGEDALALMNCLQTWGAQLEEWGDSVLVRGWHAHPRSHQTLNPANAGAVARFLMALAPLTDQTTFLTEYHSLASRPQVDLFDALRSLGLQVNAQDERLPVTISGTVSGNSVRVRADKSSQYASGLFFLAPLLPRGLTIYLDGDIKSHAPLRQTLHTLAQFGVQAECSEDLRRVHIPPQCYQSRELTVPADYPSAAAIMVAAALVPSHVVLTGLDPHDLQGERLAVKVLQDMGADLIQTKDAITIRGGQPLWALSRDGDPFTDAVQVLTAAAAHAQGVTTWKNVETLRYKECNRISDTVQVLRDLGWEVYETHDSLSIKGGIRKDGIHEVSGYGDHRMIMMLTALALSGTEPLLIRDAHHIRKSYPDFFADLTSLGACFDFLPAI